MSFSPNLISRALSHSHSYIPMEVEGVVREGSASSLVLRFLEANNRDMLSPEDYALIDSCIINNPSFIERNWDAVKEALLDIFNSNRGSLESAVLRDFHRKIQLENLNSRIENFQGERTDCDDMVIEARTLIPNDCYPAKNSMFPGNVYQSNLQPNYSDDLLGNIVTSLGYEIDPSAYTLAGLFNSQPELFGSSAYCDVFPRGNESSNEEMKSEETNCTMADTISHTFLANPFQPDYNDDPPGSMFVCLGRNTGLSPYLNEPSTKGISGEWDSNIPMEENAFIKRWSKTFKESLSL